MEHRQLGAMLAVLLLVPLAPYPECGGLTSNKLSTGLTEMTLSFGPGGGTNSSLVVTLPARAQVTNATITLTAIPQTTRGYVDYTTPEKLMAVPVCSNLTLDSAGARLSSFNWSRTQSTDEDFNGDEMANVSVGNGVHISNSILGGTVREYAVADGVETGGNLSVASTPSGDILVSWTQYNRSGLARYEAYHQRFDILGNRLGPRILDADDVMLKSSDTAIASDKSGNAIIAGTWSYANGGTVTVSIKDVNGSVVTPPFPASENASSFDTDPSIVLCGQDELLVTWYSYDNREVRGRWFHLNGTAYGPEFKIGGQQSAFRSSRVALAKWKDIFYASDDIFSDGTIINITAYALRCGPDGLVVHPKRYIAGNNSLTTPSSFAVFPDGTGLVTWTSTYNELKLSVRGSLVGPSGYLLGEFPISNGPEARLNPSVCLLPEDRFACAWGRVIDGENIQLEVRVFQQDGTPESAVIPVGIARGINSTWELTVRDNNSAVVAWRSEFPFPNGEIRFAVIDFQRPFRGWIESGELDRPGTLRLAADLPPGTDCTVDVIDAHTRAITVSGLRNGHPVGNWEPYILRANLTRQSVLDLTAGPVLRSLGAGTVLNDSFDDDNLISEIENATVSGGRVALDITHQSGGLTSVTVPLPYRAISLDNFSCGVYEPSGASAQYSLRTQKSGILSQWEVLDNPDRNIASPPGEAVQWRASFLRTGPNSPELYFATLDYSLRYRTGHVLSAPVNITDGHFTAARVNCSIAGGVVNALITVDNGISYIPAPGGVWVPISRVGKVLQAMMVLAGDGNLTPFLSGFSVEYDVRSTVSGLEMSIGDDFRYVPPADAELEKGVAVRDFAPALNTITSRSDRAVNITINISSKTAGLLRASGLKLVYNVMPSITGRSPETNVTVEENQTRQFTVAVSDEDGDAVNITWEYDDDVAGYGAAFELLAEPGSAGNHTLRALARDGHFAVTTSWTVTVIFIDRNQMPRIVGKFPPGDIVINETEKSDFSVNATDPEGSLLRYAWYLDGEKVSVFDNFTYRSWYNSSGVHVLSCAVTDGSARNWTFWNVTVNNLNRAPVIVDHYPPKDLVVRKGQTVVFGVNATDPDNETLALSWWVDGLPVVDGNGRNFTLKVPWNDEREHAVRVAVSDGNSTVSREWHLRAGPPGQEISGSRPDCAIILSVVLVLVLAGAIAYYRRKPGKK